eukprot:GABW01004619.1.p1 GENE.GABW01004619.1~~GABW01004619.1.p1  ORF type:complete len:71 (+),score=0.03 GABW01004619.1:64-276(+)
MDGGYECFIESLGSMQRTCQFRTQWAASSLRNPQSEGSHHNTIMSDNIAWILGASKNEWWNITDVQGFGA